MKGPSSFVTFERRLAEEHRGEAEREAARLGIEPKPLPPPRGGAPHKPVIGDRKSVTTVVTGKDFAGLLAGAQAAGQSVATYLRGLVQKDNVTRMDPSAV
jgi:hypothetical protein